MFVIIMVILEGFCKIITEFICTPTVTMRGTVSFIKYLLMLLPHLLDKSDLFIRRSLTPSNGLIKEEA